MYVHKYKRPGPPSTTCTCAVHTCQKPAKNYFYFLLDTCQLIVYLCIKQIRNIMKTNKYSYLRVIQQNYGASYGWEDVSTYAANSQGVVTEMRGKFKTYPRGKKREITAISHDFAEYILTGYPTRIIFRKTLNA